MARACPRGQGAWLGWDLLPWVLTPRGARAPHTASPQLAAEEEEEVGGLRGWRKKRKDL